MGIGRGGSEHGPQREPLAHKDLVIELFTSSNFFALIFQNSVPRVINLSWFAQDSPSFSSESPVSLQHPQSQANLSGSSPYVYTSSTFLKIEI